MNKFTIEPGLKFLRGELPFTVVSRDDTNVVIENTIKGSREVLRASAMEINFLNGDLIAVFDNPVDEETSVAALDMLNEAERNTYNRKRTYIKKLIELSQMVNFRKHVGQCIREGAAMLGDPRPPSSSTIYRWVKAWRAGGENLAALVPKTRKRGPRCMHMRKDAQKIVRAVLEDKFLVREEPNLPAVMPDIEGAFKKYNEDLEEWERLPIPSLSSVYRFLKRMDAYEVMVKRKGKQAADQYYRAVGAGVVADAPLDLVQIDHTILDIQVLSPVANVVARPTLTVALDVHSRMPLGIYVGFASPGYEAVMLCLRNAILPKNKLLERFSEIKGSWPCYGVPRTIVLDNGMEFHSSHLKDVCAMLGMNVVYHPVKAPHYKGAVERFFRTVNTGLLSTLPGRTFPNPQQKGDYDAVSKAAIPFKVFEEILHKWIVDVYARKFHTGLEDFPVEVWDKGVTEHPVDLPINAEDLLILLSEVRRPTLTNQGIQVDKVEYNSDELNAYFRRLGKKTKVKVKIDPLDLGHAFVFDEQGQTFIKVPAKNGAYTGLGKWKHTVLKRLVNLRRKEGNDEYDVSDALLEIGRHVETASAAGKKKSHRRRARYGEHGEVNKPPTGSALSLDQSPPDPMDFDFDSMDVSDLLDAAAAAGWGNLNDKGDE